MREHMDEYVRQVSENVPRLLYYAPTRRLFPRFFFVEKERFRAQDQVSTYEYQGRVSWTRQWETFFGTNTFFGQNVWGTLSAQSALILILEIYSILPASYVIFSTYADDINFLGGYPLIKLIKK